MASVEIVEASKAFGAHAVLHGVSLEVRDGEFVVLVGPSGCGKSTLLRMVAGLEAITAGEVLIGERVVNHLPPKERDIAMVFQSYALYPHMRVAENMSFSLRLARRPKAEVAGQVDRAARILDLGQLLARYPRELSGGQRQRVAMGRAIVRDPAVFLFDEPLSNLDAQLRVAMRAEIKALHRRLGTTTIYVTHDQVEAMTMADRIVVMRAGRIEQVGTPLELYDHPANAFVATFIGSPAMNLIRGSVEASPEGPRLRLPDGPPWLLPREVAAEAGRAVSLGIRPEDLRMDLRADRGAAPGGPDGIPARVVVTEPTGAETHVVMAVGGAQVVGVFRERLVLEPDQEVVLRPDWARAHLFDAGSGLRLGPGGR